MDAAAAAGRFESEIARYHKWREELTQSVHAYHDWLEATGQLDVQQSIRFYDLLENLNRGRLMLAFLAEFSRGKSELINALFFSDFKERLLPSDVGRTTMCPTEIFHDPSEEPYLKLLSVETRYRDESISQLKNVPIEWSKVRLNTSSAAEMKKSLKALADTKKVYALEARMLGLAPMLNEKGEAPGEEELVEVPAWRYAMINYPHPLLTNGISILDTPGLNALGMEPELTVSTIPNAHAVLFLLSIDTGVTKSDLEIWERYVKPGLPQKLAVLNKIDVMWDDLKTPAEIEGAIARMVQTTAQHLQLPRERVFPLSAQKALLGRIRGDDALVKKSGIEHLERFLAEDIIPMKRQILAKAVVGEIGGMMSSSRASITKKQQANQAEVAELNGLVGKSRQVVQQLWAKITAEKNAYNAALAEYKVNHQQFSAKKTALLDMLNPQKLDQHLAKSAQAIEDSWLTVNLQRGMSSLVKDMSADFEAVFKASEDIKKLMQAVYNTFIEKFGFQKMKLPSLDLDPQRTKLQLLVMQTEQFVKDPVNVVVKEKHFVVKNFYATLVKEARKNFGDAKTQAERWIQAVVLPLEVQIKDHKNQLQSRLDNLAKINEKTTSINEQMAELKKAEQELARQRDMIEGLITRVSQHEAKATLAPQPEPIMTAEMMESTLVQNFDESFMKAEAAATEAAKAAPAPAPTVTVTRKPGSGPLISDDLMSAIDGLGGKPADMPQALPEGHDRTQKMPEGHDRTQKLPPGADRTQKMPPGADRTQKMDTASPQTTQKMDAASPQTTQKMDAATGPQTTQRLGPTPVPEKPRGEGDKTMQIKRLDPNFKPDATQRMDPAPPTTPLDSAGNPDPESTQRIDDSLWRLEEAKRILKGVKEKN